MLTAEQQARKEQYVTSVQDASSGRPHYIPGEPCQQCYRTHLQLLVVLPSVVAKDHEAAVKQAGVSWPAAFAPALDRTKLAHAAPVARVMREGYVYLFYPDKQRWDIWQVMQNGLTRQLLQQVRVPHYAKGIQPHLDAGEIKQCRQGAANHQAHLISISYANAVGDIWMAFSPRLWSEATLQRYTDNAEVTVAGPDGKPIGTKKAREWRGVSFSPKAVAKGQRPGTHMLPLDAEHLRSHVIDFADGKSGFWPSIALRKAFAPAIEPINPIRFGVAADFAQKVRRIEEITAPTGHPDMFKGKSVILMLDDPEGVVEQLNELRNAQMEAATRYAAEHQREFLSAEVIESIKMQVEAEAEQAFDEAEAQRHEVARHHPVGTITKMGPDGKPVAWKPAELPQTTMQERRGGSVDKQSKQAWAEYADNLRDAAAPEQFLKEHRAQIEKFQKAVEQAAADQLTWLDHPRTLAMRQMDFDPGTRRDATGYEQMACNLIHGMGVTDRCKQWMETQVVHKKPGAPEALVWNALLGNQKDVTEHVLAALQAPKWDKVYSNLKKALTFPDRGKDTPAGRLAGGWERVLATAAGPLSKALSDDNANRIVKTLFEGVIWTRAGAMWAQHSFTTSDGLRGLARFFEFSTWRMVDMTLSLDGSNPFAFKRDFGTRMAVPGQAPVLAATLPQPKPDAVSGLRYVVVAPETVEAAQNTMRQFGQMREVSTALAADAFANVKKGFNLDGRLSAISLVFELINYHKAEGTLAKADRFKQPQAEAALRAAVLGGVNAAADIRAAWVKGVYGENLQWGVTKGLGGLCGGVASFIGAYWAWENAGERSADGQKGLAYLYRGAAVAGLVSGSATIASGTASFLQAVKRMKPTTAATTRAFAARLGIRAGLIGLAVAALIWAFEKKPIAEWMSRTCWGKKPKDQQWRDWDEEMRELDKLIKVKPT